MPIRLQSQISIRSSLLRKEVNIVFALVVLVLVGFCRSMGLIIERDELHRALAHHTLLPDIHSTDFLQ